MPTLMLMYHDLAANSASIPPQHRPYVLDASTFRLQMDALVASGLPMFTVTQWCTLPHPPRALALTFDDGHVSNHDIALPVLLERKLTATFFITVGCIGNGTTMNWTQIRALHDAGMEIGSHTLTHRPPSTLSNDELRHELLESRRILEENLGAPVTSVSSPTGFFNPRMRAIAREVGYRALCFGRVGFVADHGDPFSLHRVAVKRTMPQTQFEAMLQFDSSMVRRLWLQQWVRDLARKMLGVETYLCIRRLFIHGRGRG